MALNISNITDLEVTLQAGLTMRHSFASQQIYIYIQYRLGHIIIAVSGFVCHSPNTTACHHRLGDDSRLCLGLAAQNKHTTRKYNISAREPGGTDVILAHFL